MAEIAEDIGVTDVGAMLIQICANIETVLKWRPYLKQTALCSNHLNLQSKLSLNRR